MGNEKWEVNIQEMRTDDQPPEGLADKRQEEVSWAAQEQRPARNLKNTETSQKEKEEKDKKRYQQQQQSKDLQEIGF